MQVFAGELSGHGRAACMRSPSHAARSALCATVILCAARATSAAQDSTRAAHTATLFGVTVGLPGVGANSVPQLTTVGLTVTENRPGRLGADLAVGMSPRTLADGFVALGVSGGVALPLAVAPGVSVLPSAGASVLAGSNGRAQLGVLGLNAGIAGVVLRPGGDGFRAGITWYAFSLFSRVVWLFEVGYVLGR